MNASRPPGKRSRNGVEQQSVQELADQHNAADDQVVGEAAEGGDDVEVVMACTYANNRLGVAVYDCTKNTISVMQSFEDGNTAFAFQMLQMVKLQVEPDVIYLSSIADPEFRQQCAQGLAADAEPVQLLSKRSGIFHHDKALSKLQILYVRGMAPSSNPREHLLYLGRYMDVGSVHQVSALGALLAIMQQDGFAFSADDDVSAELGPGFVVVEQLSELSMQGALMIDSTALRALQIFQEETHPSKMGIGKAKEGFSVFGMMQRCVTNMGRRLLKLWFLRPIIDLQALRNRHDSIEAFMLHPDVAVSLSSILKNIHDIPKLLLKIQKSQGHFEAAIFKQFTDSAAHMLTLQHLIKSLAPAMASTLSDEQGGQQEDPLSGISFGVHGRPQPDLNSPFARRPEQTLQAEPGIWDKLVPLQQVYSCITEDISACHTMLLDVLDFSQADEGMIIKFGICDQLDEMKLLYHGLPDFLTKVVEEELRSIPSYLASRNSKQLWSMVYLPQVGYVMQVAGCLLPPELLDVLPDYSMAFEADTDDGHCAYYYCDRSRQLSQEFGDLLYKIQDLEASLCIEMTKRILTYAPQLQRAANAMAELDCVISLAACAREYNLSRPILTEDNVLSIKRGRHLLAEMAVDSFIPNSTEMGSEAGRVHIITGPNASGKSCYAKQVAIIVYLAHVGCFVPAQEAVVGLTDCILTRLVSQSSIPTGSQSTFMIDLRQMAFMVQKATPRSLLVVDEFGKGTLAADGVGLLASIVRHFCSTLAPPKALITTHFTEVFDEQYLPRSPAVAFYCMEVASMPTIDSNHADHSSIVEPVFLYKLAPGNAHSSYGVHCAKLAGVPESILQRCRHIMALRQSGEPLQRVQDRRLRNQDMAALQLVSALKDAELDDVQEVVDLLASGS